MEGGSYSIRNIELTERVTASPLYIFDILENKLGSGTVHAATVQMEDGDGGPVLTIKIGTHEFYIFSQAPDRLTLGHETEYTKTRKL